MFPYGIPLRFANRTSNSSKQVLNMRPLGLLWVFKEKENGFPSMQDWKSNSRPWQTHQGNITFWNIFRKATIWLPLKIALSKCQQLVHVYKDSFYFSDFLHLIILSYCYSPMNTTYFWLCFYLPHGGGGHVSSKFFFKLFHHLLNAYNEISTLRGAKRNSKNRVI